LHHGADDCWLCRLVCCTRLHQLHPHVRR
jgi:hypothetical protein